MNEESKRPDNFTLSVDGMTCGHCIKAVTIALAAVPGVTVRTVAVGSAQITAPDGAAVARAIAALEDAGSQARANELTAGSAGRSATGDAFYEGAAASDTRQGQRCCG